MSSEAPPSPIAADGYHDVRWSPERVSRLWGYYGNSAAHASAYFSKIFGANILKTLEAWGVALDGAQIVDFGCGPGHLLQHLLQDFKPKDAWGVEFSKQSAERATELLRGFAPFRGVVEAGSVPVNLADGCCDVLFLVEVVEHLDDFILKGTIAEAKRLLRPGGLLVVTTPNAEELDRSKTACPDCGCVFHIWQHVRSWTADSLRAYLEQADLKTIRSTSTQWAPPNAETMLSKARRLRDWLQGRNRGPDPYLAYVGRR